MTLFFCLDGGRKNPEGWETDWIPSTFCGVNDHRAHGSEASVIKGKGGRGRAVCMMGTKLPGFSNKVCM